MELSFLYGVLGEVQYSKDKNLIQCHICGRWYRNLCSSHVPRIHEMTAYEYKERFGLCNTWGLVGKDTRKKYSLKKSLSQYWKIKPHGGKISDSPIRLQARRMRSEQWGKIGILGRLALVAKSKKRFKKMLEFRLAGWSYQRLAKHFKYKSVNAFRKKYNYWLHKFG